MIKLNVGSNAVVLEGWINIDIEDIEGVVQHDVRERFPYVDNSIDFIFSEHFIEHLTEAEGIFYLTECFRMLKPGGVVRTSTFSMDSIFKELLTNESWEKYSQWVCKGAFQGCSRMDFFNRAVYEAGYHKHMYNNEEMIRILKLAGFTSFAEPEMRGSIHPELQGLEVRDNSDCIVEAVR